MTTIGSPRWGTQYTRAGVYISSQEMKMGQKTSVLPRGLSQKADAYLPTTTAEAHLEGRAGDGGKK